MATVAETEKWIYFTSTMRFLTRSAPFLRANHSKPSGASSFTTLHGTELHLSAPSFVSAFYALTGLFSSDGVTAISHYLKEATNEIFHLTDIEVNPHFHLPD